MNGRNATGLHLMSRQKGRIGTGDTSRWTTIFSPEIHLFAPENPHINRIHQGMVVNTLFWHECIVHTVPRHSLSVVMNRIYIQTLTMCASPKGKQIILWPFKELDDIRIMTSAMLDVG
mgnify:CR=1 FL=1